MVRSGEVGAMSLDDSGGEMDITGFEGGVERGLRRGDDDRGENQVER